VRSSKVFDALQNLISFKPSQAQIGKIIGVGASAIGNRVARDADFSDEEIEKIESFYGIVGQISGNHNDCIELDYYPDVFGSCGTGSFILSEQKEKISLSKDSIMNYSSGAHYSVINAIGDSMTPYIQDKDKLIVKHWNGEQIKDNNIYVFRYCEEIFVKRLSKNIDQIVIMSDNPIYDVRKIPVSNDFQIIGQIVGLLRKM